MGIHQEIGRFAPKTSRRGGRPNKETGRVIPLRCKDLNKLFQYRYGITLPDDDAGRDEAEVMLAHLAALTNAEDRMDHFLDLRCPWMPGSERATIKALAEHSRSWWTADQLAARLNLNMEVRTKLGITTIGAVDFDRDARKALRLEKQRIRQRKNRSRTRKQSKSSAGISERSLVIQRALVLQEVLPEKGWMSVREISDELADSASFAGLSAIKGAIHTALKKAETLRLVRIQKAPGPRGLTVTFVARA